MLITKMLGGEDSLNLMRSSGLYDLTASKIHLDLSNTQIKLSKLGEMAKELSRFKSLSLNIRLDIFDVDIGLLLGKITDLILSGKKYYLNIFEKSPLKSLELEYDMGKQLSDILYKFPTLEKLIINNVTSTKVFKKISRLNTPTRLKHLDVPIIDGRNNWIFKSLLPDLETLIVRDAHETYYFDGNLYNCKKLKVLKLYGETNGKDILYLSKFENLERFISRSDGYKTTYIDADFVIKSPTIKYIEISNINSFSDVYNFSDCTNLEKLYLSCDNVYDTTILLERCTKLKELEIFAKSLTDLNFLADCPQLRSLKIISSEGMNNIEVIENCTELEVLDISQSTVVDISSLAGLIKLKKLNLSRTKISDISSLSNCINLEVLNLRATNINDLTPISNCTKLEVLNLRDTNINDLTPISNCTKLERINLNRTNILSLKPLANLTSLTYIDLSHTYITNLNKAAKWINLSYIRAYECELLSSVKGLSNCMKLKYADFTGSDIITLQGLEKCRSLIELICNDCEKLRDITALFNHTNLRKLFINNTSIKSINSLSNCTNLENLTLRRNRNLVDGEKVIVKLKSLISYNGDSVMVDIMTIDDSDYDEDYDEDED